MKAKKIIAIAITAIASLLVVFSGIMKLTQNPDAVKLLTSYGVGDYIMLLGIMEIVFAALFVYPPTRKLGFILLSCYFAGAMATDLSHGADISHPLFPMVLIWVAAFLSDKSIFLSFTESK